MATSMEKIRSILSERGLVWFEHPEDRRLLLPFPYGSQTINVVLHSHCSESDEEAPDPRSRDSVEDITMVNVRVPTFLKAGSENRERLLLKMMEINYRCFGKLSMDPRDGEVVFEVEIPLGDAPFTDGQFDRAMGSVHWMIAEHRDRLIRISEGEEDEPEQDDILAKLLEDFDGESIDDEESLEPALEDSEEGE